VAGKSGLAFDGLGVQHLDSAIAHLCERHKPIHGTEKHTAMVARCARGIREGGNRRNAGMAKENGVQVGYRFLTAPDKIKPWT
jgi:hypothetical protein